MTEYLFDVKLFASIRVRAESEQAAKRMIDTHLDGTEANFGAWQDGSPILAQVCLDGEHDLLEIDGSPVE